MTEPAVPGRWWLWVATVVLLLGLGVWWWAWPGPPAMDQPLSAAASPPPPAAEPDTPPADEHGVRRYDRVWRSWDVYRPPRLPDDLRLPQGVAGPPAPGSVSAAGWQTLPTRVLQQGQTPRLPDGTRPPGAPADGDGEGQWWYAVDYRVPAEAAGQGGGLGLYVPRASGASVQVLRRQGDSWVLMWDGSAQWREQWNRPVLVDVGAMPRPGEVVQLALGMHRPLSRGHRLSRISVGPWAVLQGRARWRQVLQHTVPQVSSLAFVVLGLMTAVYWLGRRADRAYLLFSLTAVAWFLRNLHYYISFPTTPWMYEWVWWLSNASLSWVMVLTLLFALRFDQRRYPALERCLLIFVLLASLLTMPGPWPDLGSLAQQHAVNALVAFGVLAWLSSMCWRQGNRELQVIVLALLLTDAAGLQDLMLLAGAVSPESIYLLPLSTLTILCAFLYAVQTRYTQAIGRVEQANVLLEQRLAEREAELHANHALLRGIEREQALLLERQRLMRDMHDGLGSTLMSSLVLVEQGQLDHEALAALLRECVDDLRLVIDSLEPIGHDLVTLLASLRYRLGRRLEAAGLEMQWAVDDLPPLTWLHPPDALQVLRIVQEVLTNVLKHAHARRVRISTACVGAWVEVVIEDDGQGFALDSQPRGRGLTHLHQRAERLGGRVELQSAPGVGTRLRLTLPLERESLA